jgi:hypothetical protein
MVKAACFGGVFEVLVGVPDIGEATRYFAGFGCREGPRGVLPAERAAALYGVASPLQSVRLLHRDSDHGLVRLMQWERPRNRGLGLDSSLRCDGSRWGVRLTSDVLNLANHAECARQNGAQIECIEPLFAVIGEVTGAAGKPFQTPLVGVREMLIIQPHYRQVFFQRFGYDSPLYGQIEPHCLFACSQHTHFGLMLMNDDHQVLRFYDETLGLERWFDAERPYESATGSRRIFGLAAGETHWMVDFDDVRSGHALHERRSGKLKIVRFARSSCLPDKRELARPGSLGYSCYTLRTRDAAALRRRVAAGGATKISDIVPDEFGVSAFSCHAPDGSSWVFVEVDA